MANSRTPRDIDTREKSQARAVYQPAATLPTPAPQNGYMFHWVATHVNGQAVPTNVSQKFRDGYEPCKAADHPEMMLSGNQDGNIEVGGLMLCKILEERYYARKEYYEKQAQDQMNSVDNHFMRNNDARMPLFSERKSTVSRGSGFGNGSK
jgi:hypothetical protein